MISKENNCVGCPQGCIHCGRELDEIILICDSCYEQVDELYICDGKQLCSKCALDTHEKITADDISDDFLNYIKN